MPIEWWSGALSWIKGVEPYEVTQALARPSLPREADSPFGRVLTIWCRTSAGRGLVVVLRPGEPFQHWIIGVLPMTPEQDSEFAEWEASRD